MQGKIQFIIYWKFVLLEWKWGYCLAYSWGGNRGDSKDWWNEKIGWGYIYIFINTSSWKIVIYIYSSILRIEIFTKKETLPEATVQLQRKSPRHPTKDLNKAQAPKNFAPRMKCFIQWKQFQIPLIYFCSADLKWMIQFVALHLVHSNTLKDQMIKFRSEIV